MCYQRVCYQRVCYERVWYERVCYERVCYERVCDERVCCVTYHKLDAPRCYPPGCAARERSEGGASPRTFGAPFV